MKNKVLELISTMGEGGAESLVKDYALMINKGAFDISILTVYHVKHSTTIPSLEEAGISVKSILPGLNIFWKLVKWTIGTFYVPYKILNYIRENENLRQTLLAQEGGIMKYLAEHLDANDSATLFKDYQDQCVEKFHEANKWVLYKVWEGDDMRRAALGEAEHFRKELRYQEALKPLLAELPKKEAEKIDDFIEMYLTYAYKQDRLRRHPNGMTNIDVYQEIVGMFSSIGLAYKCMKLILREHHSKGNIKKTESDVLTEFSIRQWSDQLTIMAFFKMRQAVAEMLVGKGNDQCRFVFLCCR